MKIPSAAKVRKNAQLRLGLFGKGLARNPRYLQFYDLFSHMLEHEMLEHERIDLKRAREETILDEVWDFLKSNDKLFTQAAREKGNPLRGKWHIAKQYMWNALEKEFFIGFPVKPIQLTTGWTNLAPPEIGATVISNGETIPGLIHVVSPDNGGMPSGQGMTIDLACSNKFLVSYDWAEWESLSAKEKMHCVCLDVNLQHPHVGHLLTDFRSLLQPLKKHLTVNASNGEKLRLKPNRDLISSFKSALRPTLPNKRRRHSGDEIERWFLAYDLSRWGMPFEKALKEHGYRATATVADNSRLRPKEIAQRMFPMQIAGALRDGRSIKRFVQKIQDYIENARSQIYMQYEQS